MADKIAGSDFEQRSDSDAGPAGVKYRDVRNRALPLQRIALPCRVRQ